MTLFVKLPIKCTQHWHLFSTSDNLEKKKRKKKDLHIISAAPQFITSLVYRSQVPYYVLTGNSKRNNVRSEKKYDEQRF